LVITYIITMFTLYCLTKIIDFLFDLDRKNWIRLNVLIALDITLL
jgi:hypothetical protein